MLRSSAKIRAVGALGILIACARPNASGPAVAPITSSDISAHGRVLSVSTGTPLIFCTAPGLSVDLRLDSTVAPGAPMAMGTAELTAGGVNAGTHRDTDEALYFLSDGGRAFVGPDTVQVSRGLVLWIPRGVRHGFWSPPASPIRFVWVNVPQGLAQRFRSVGVAPSTACPTPK